jgi:glycerol kinase
MLFDHHGNICGVAQKEFKQIFPKPGWVEHDAEEIWSTQYGTMAEALAKANITMKQIAGIGITNQRETTVVWERKTGKPVYNAIVWQDRRTAAYCDELKAANHAKTIQEKTGLIIDAYFSATKLKWILDNVSDARKKAENGELAFGTIDSWLTWKLSGGELHVTDVSNASRTMLLNIHTCQWDEDLQKLFSIPKSLLPEVKPSSKIYGVTGSTVPTPDSIAGIAGDQQAALFGQLCTQPVVRPMVRLFHADEYGRKTIHRTTIYYHIAWKIDDKVEYALEGSVFIAGALVQWLRWIKIIRIHRCENWRSRSSIQMVFTGSGIRWVGAPLESIRKGNCFGLTG